MQKPFMMIFTNKNKGAGFSHFEIELMQAFVAPDGTVYEESAEPDDEDADNTLGPPSYAVFGKFRHDLCEKKGARQEIASFETFEEASELLHNMGVIDEKENG